MRGLCTEVAPEHGTLHQVIRFRDDLPENPAVTAASVDHNEVVVRVRTATIAVDDIHGAEGTYLTFNRTSPKHGAVTEDAPYVPGFECCGEVVRAGTTALQKFPLGSLVLCFQSTKNQRYGTWGEYFTFSPKRSSVDTPVIFPKPNHLTDAQAVAALVPLRVATCTLSKPVYRAMADTNDNASSRTMVVVGASGAVGSIVLQAARHEWPRADLIAICSAGKRDYALRNGASKVIAYDEDSEWSLHSSVYGKTDVVLDLIGGSESLRHGQQALRRGGVFNTTVGPERFLGDGGHLSLWYFLCKLVPMLGRLVGNLWRSSYKYYVRDMSYHSNVECFTRLLEDEKAIIPELDWVVDIENEKMIKEAIQRVRHHKTTGRLVLRVSKS